MGYSQLFQVPYDDTPAIPNISAPCLNVTNTSRFIYYIGSADWTGYTIASYKGTATPVIDIANKRITFSQAGTIWDISIKDSNSVEVIFLPCQEGGGNNNKNRTLHNQYADNYTDHFLSAGIGWTTTLRRDTYRHGFSLKHQIPNLIRERIRNGTFDSGLNNWTKGLNTNPTNSSNRLFLRALSQGNHRPRVHQHIGLIHKIFQYRQYASFYGRSAVMYISYNDSVGHIKGGTFYGGPIISVITHNGNSWVNKTHISYINPAYCSNIYCTLLMFVTSSYFKSYYDNISFKIYEDDVKIPVSLNNPANDCFGNAKTSSGSTSTSSSDLVAYYPFNGNANDESGNGNHGTVNGATLTTNRFGQINKAYNFVRNNSQNINFGNIKHNDNNITVALWVKFNTLNNVVLFFQHDYSSSVSLYISIYLRKLTIGASSANSVSMMIEHGDRLNTNKWYFIVSTFEERSIKLYIDSIRITNFSIYQTSSSSGNWYSPNSVTIVGGDTIINKYYLDGKLDDVRIYNKVLTTAEIKALYRKTPTTAV